MSYPFSRVWVSCHIMILLAWYVWPLCLWAQTDDVGQTHQRDGGAKYWMIVLAILYVWTHCCVGTTDDLQTQHGLKCKTTCSYISYLWAYCCVSTNDYLQTHHHHAPTARHTSVPLPGLMSAGDWTEKSSTHSSHIPGGININDKHSSRSISHVLSVPK